MIVRQALLFTFLAFAVSMADAAVFCSQTHSEIQYTQVEAIARARYWSLPQFSKKNLLHNLFKNNVVPQNLVVDSPVMANRLSARDRQVVRAIIEDMNYRIGFFYESRLQVTIARDLTGEPWAVYVAQKNSSLPADAVSVYSIENRGGRKVPEMVFDYSDAAIL